MQILIFTTGCSCSILIWASTQEIIIYKILMLFVFTSIFVFLKLHHCRSFPLWFKDFLSKYQLYCNGGCCSCSFQLVAWRLNNPLDSVNRALGSRFSLVIPGSVSSVFLAAVAHEATPSSPAVSLSQLSVIILVRGRAHPVISVTPGQQPQLFQGLLVVGYLGPLGQEAGGHTADVEGTGSAVQLREPGVQCRPWLERCHDGRGTNGLRQRCRNKLV